MSTTSTATARISTPPVAKLCTSVDRPSSWTPLLIDPMTSAPSSADQTVPRPPNRLVPPTTAAAIALSMSGPPPDELETPSSREASTMPAATAHRPEDEEGVDDHPRDRDAGALGGLAVAADGVEVDAVPGLGRGSTTRPAA